MTEQLKSEERLGIGKRIIAFIGPEGSGKTTVARRLAEESGMPYVTTGDTIRDLAANDPGPLGEECRIMFAEKTYLSGETLLKILVHRLSQSDTADGLVLDGGLRTYEETLAFQLMLDEAERKLPMTVVYLQIPESMTYDRLVNGENARKRADDTPEGVEARLSKFNHRLDERIGIIEDQSTWELVPVDGTGSEDEVYEKVLGCIINL